MDYIPKVGDRVRVRRRYDNGELFGWVHGYVRRIDDLFQAPTVCLTLMEFENPDGDRTKLVGHGWYKVADCERKVSDAVV